MSHPPSQSVSSSDQTGGVTAGTINALNYYSMPPVTEQERAVALERLNLTLAELATYRERPADLGQLTILETIRTDKTARQLYIVLSNFFDPTIAQANNGAELLAFKKTYNHFIRDETRLESISIEYIGKNGPTRFSAGWEALLRYMVLRAYRGSKEEVQASGLVLFEANWDQAEEFYGKFVTDQKGGAWLNPQAHELESLIAAANQLLKPHEKN